MEKGEIESFLANAKEGHIEGVLLSPRKIISDARGSVMHALRSDSPEFKGFGETYVSTVNYGVWKEWKRHKEMVQSFVVPCGCVEFLMKDCREDSATVGNWKRVSLSRENYSLLQIPAMVWYAFYGMKEGENIIVNTASIPHLQEETERL